MFIAQTSSLARNGASNERLNKLFRTRTVRLQGILEAIDLDERLPVVTVRMQEIKADLGQGKTATVDVLSLPIAENAVLLHEAAKHGMDPGQ